MIPAFFHPHGWFYLSAANPRPHSMESRSSCTCSLWVSKNFILSFSCVLFKFWRALGIRSHHILHKRCMAPPFDKHSLQLRPLPLVFLQLRVIVPEYPSRAFPHIVDLDPKPSLSICMILNPVRALHRCGINFQCRWHMREVLPDGILYLGIHITMCSKLAAWRLWMWRHFCVEK